MSDYVKITDYASKDALLSGDLNKLVKGTEIGADFDAVAVAIATKVDENGALGTPSSGTLTNCTGLPISTGVSGLGTGVATALAVNVGSAGAPVVNGGVLGTPSSGTLTNCTGLPPAGVSGTALVSADIGASVQAYDADLTTWAGKTAPSGTVVGNTDTQTLTNKTITDSTNTVYANGGPGGTEFSFRNRLLNPSGAIYQRDVAATADDTYFADRWYMLTQTGTVTPSVLTDPEDGYPTGIRITQSQASAQRFGFAQIIAGKNCKDMRGGSGVLVPRIRASASQAIRYAILGWTSTEDSVTSDVVNDWTSATYTAGNFFLAANLSVIAVGAQTPSANTWTSLTALTASLGSTFNNIICMVWTEGTAAQNFTLDFDLVDFQPGSIVVPETRPIEIERGLCKEYLQTYTSNGTTSFLPWVGFGAGDTNAYGTFILDVTPRVPPTGVTVSNATHFSINDGSNTIACTGLTIQNSEGSGNAVYIRATIGVNTTQYRPYSLLFNNSSGKILFTGCEL